jgi:hypothetical protein
MKCPQCGVTALLVGLDQIDSTLCIDCLEAKRRKPEIRKKYEDAWTKVRPADETPTVVRRNPAKGGQQIVEHLPSLNPAEQALIALVQPVVTIRRNFVACRKYRQECLNLLHNPEKTWCKILPRKDLHDRFVVIERRHKSSTMKYMIADPSKVRVWLRYLFQNHSTYLRKRQNGEIEMSDEALEALQAQSELASVDYDSNLTDVETAVDETEYPPPSAELDAGLSRNELFCFEQNEYLYLRKEHALKVTRDGKIEKISDDDECRQPVYNPIISANVAFPHLYPNAEDAPMDCGQHTLARFLLKKQSQFAQRTADGKLQWTHGEHGVHMMHQYARLVEMNVRALVGWYINQHPERANVPLQSLIDAFRQGLNNDQSAIDSQMPELEAIMTKIRNSRQKWYSQRLNIEKIAEDCGDANLFFTLNCDPRAWPDVRKLLYELNEGSDKTMPADYFESNTEKFTKLLDKFATQISLYLNKKVKLFIKAFLCDICRIPERESGNDITHPADRIDHGWYWTRVEFTETRGVQHWHCLAKLPGILDTAI